MVNGSFGRGVETLGDIEPFEDAGQTDSQKLAVPQRAPDVAAECRIADSQAHIYRFSGDYDPLPMDPEAARFGGFDAPILHDHCARLLLAALADGDPARFRTIKARISAPVFPHDALTVRAWKEETGRVAFEARVDDRAVVSNACFEYAA